LEVGDWIFFGAWSLGFGAFKLPRMTDEHPADELRLRKKLERVNGIAPLSRPWHDRILLLNHTRKKKMQNAEGRMKN